MNSGLVDHEVRLYPRGFIAVVKSAYTSANVVNIPEHFVRLDFGGMDIWVDSETGLGRARSRGIDVIVFGLAVNVLAADSTRESTADVAAVAKVLQEALLNGTESFLEELDRTAGRYVVMAEADGVVRLFHDAHGTRSVYYSTALGACASHAELLSEVVGAERRDTSELESDTSWASLPLSFAWDDSPFRDIKALLPNYYLTPTDGRVSRYFPRENNRYSAWSESQRVEEVVRLWTEEMRVLSEVTDRFIISLSGGLDSRVVLAGSKNYQDKVDAFTYFSSSGDSKWANTLKMDRDIAEELLIGTQVNHVELDRARNLTLSEEQDGIVSRNSLVRHGRWLVAHYLEEYGRTSNVHLRGNLQETMRLYFGRRADRDPIELIKSIYSRQLESLDASDQIVETFKQKLSDTLASFGYPNELFDYDPSDIFYWENRMGRWISEIYNETDAAFNTISPVNMRAIVQVGLAYPMEDRREGKIFRDLINSFWPSLNFPGINTRQNLYSQWRAETEHNRVLSDSVRFVPPWIVESELSRSDPFSGVPLRLDSTETVIDSVADGEYWFPEECLVENAFVHRTISWPVFDDSNSSTVPTARSDVYVFSLRNTFVNALGTSYLRFEVRVNGQLVAANRFGVDGKESYWAVYGLEPGDEFCIGVRSLKNAKAKSWSRASRTTVRGLCPPLEYWGKMPALGLGFASTSVSASSRI